VAGIEPTAAALVAKTRLDDAVQGYFPADLPSTWAPFDVICFNDVLEHIPDPWSVLRATHAWLAPGGQVIASIPNVRFLDVLVDLVVRGKWTYMPTGVLDQTHLRFFTRASLEPLFHDAGYALDLVRATHFTESKYTLIRALGSRMGPIFPGILAQRYLVVASPTARSTTTARTARPT
jgi:SAM-dependent methyltransferase